MKTLNQHDSVFYEEQALGKVTIVQNVVIINVTNE